jgi:ATP-dependent Clp protease ATP-binding subunit ClpA
VATGGAEGAGGVFVRYTLKARRTIFFARYFAGRAGSPQIEPEHLLLGLVEEDAELMGRFLRTPAAAEMIRAEVEVQGTIEAELGRDARLPLSGACREILEMAVEEADRLQHAHISTGHMLLALLRAEGSGARSILVDSVIGTRMRLTAIRNNIEELLERELG